MRRNVNLFTFKKEDALGLTEGYSPRARLPEAWHGTPTSEKQVALGEAEREAEVRWARRKLGWGYAHSSHCKWKGTREKDKVGASWCPSWKRCTGQIRPGLETVKLCWNCWRCDFRWILSEQTLFSTIVDLVDEQGPCAKPDNLRGGQRGGSTISDT